MPVTVLALVLPVLPATIVLGGGLRSAGAPVRLLGVGLLVLTVLGGLHRTIGGGRLPTFGSAPVQWFVWAWLGIAVASYGTAFTRPLTEAESAGALRALVAMVGYAGVALYTAGALADRRAVHKLFRALVLAGGVCALMGILQSAVQIDWASLMRPPGFDLNRDVSVGERSTFTRVLGGTVHPIEFSVLMGALLAPGLHLSWHDNLRWRTVARTSSLLMAVSLPLAVSRSGVISAAIAVGLVALSWPWERRVATAALTAVGAVAFAFVRPGLLGTIRALFTNAEADNSVSGRTDDYAIVGQLVAERPWLGLGLGTFRPDVYLFLDNQFLLTLLELGWVGLVGTVALLVAGVVVGLTGKNLEDAEMTSLRLAVVGALMAVTVSGITFDLFSFAQASTLLFLLLGVAGSLWRPGRSGSRRTPLGVAGRWPRRTTTAG